MIKNQSVVIGGGALLLGLILGIAVSGSRVDDKIAQAMGRMDEASGAAVSAQEAAMAAIEERFGALEAQVEEAAGAAAALSDDLGAKMSEMQQGLASRIDAVTEGAQAQVAALRDEFASAPTTGTAGSAETAAAPAAGMAAAETRSVGETAVLADGALRVFVSRLDTEAGTARLSINGTDTTLAVGDAATVALESGDCAVSVVSIGADGVALASDCGEAAVADVPAAPEAGFRPGEVAILADGALRVFVSGLAADNSAARLAINGLSLETVASGGFVDVASGDKSCTVSVTGVGNGLVGLDGSCG